MTLSSAQRGLWALDQLTPGSSVYNVPVAYRLAGTLDVGRLDAALAEVVGRHDALRTSIVSDEGSPVARVRPAGDFRLTVVDLTDVAAGRREAEALRRATADAEAPFDLAEDLPVRASLLRLAGDDHVLSLTFHHVASDERSVRTVLDEVGRAYAGEDLPPVRLQYADVARRESETLAGEDLDVLLAYWRKTMRDAPAAMGLPFDRPAPVVPTFKGAVVEAPPAPDAVEAIERVAAAHGSSRDAAHVAALAVLLHRYTSDDDLVVGWSVDGRSEFTRDVVGTFVNVLPLRLDLSGRPSFAGVLERAQRALDGLVEHRELPFEKLVEALHPGRGTGASPLFQVAVAVDDDAPPPELRLAGARSTPLSLEARSAEFDLFVEVRKASARFELAIDVFDAATVGAMARHWTDLLRALAADPAAPVATLPMLGEAERRELLGPPATAREPALVPEQIARHDPGATAIVAGSTSLSYGELEREARAVAATLIARGVPRGSVVALPADRGPAMIPSMLGIMRAGCAYLPLDPAYPRKRLRLMLEDSGAAAVVGPAGDLDVPGAVPVIEARDDAGATLPEVDRTDGAYVIYTSGSTGHPKGVLVEHGSLASFCDAIAGEVALTSEDRVLQFASPSFDTAVEEIWPALCRGATVVLRGPDPWDPEELKAKAGELGITVLDLPTAYWHELAAASADGIDVRECASLRLVVVGGEAMSAERTRLWRRSKRRPVSLLNTYGPTETTVTATSFDVAAWDGRGPIPIGAPLESASTYVLDDELEPVPAGVLGELFVGGAGVARGYLGNPSATAERFVPDPFAGAPGARMYRTGDRARRRRDGHLEFAGRRDDQVKVRGFRIEPGEVEAVLATHPAVRAAAVVLSEDDNPRLVCHVAGEVDADPLREWLRERVPEHMVPAAFVAVDALPLTPSGKIDRRALAARTLGAERPQVRAPRTPAEQVLASIWQRLLGLDHVGTDESFFDLGGHSLIATQLVSRIRHDFGVSLPLRTVFEWPTIAGLAGVIERFAGGTEEYDELPLRPVQRDGAIPLSFAQQRLWFIDQFKPGGADYVIAARAELRGPLDVDALKRALRTLAERHEALRTTFPSAGGEARQEVSPEPVVAFEVTDARDESAAAALIEREASRPFDLATGPLWRTALIRLAPDHHFFVTCMHHIVSDGWSLGIFASELSELYSAYVEQRQPVLAPLEISYADFAVWQRRWFQGEELERQLSYWKEQLKDAPAVLELPTDRPRPPIQSFEGATVSFAFPAELSRDVERLARAHEVTTFMVTLAAFETLLHRYTGATDVVVGSPIAGRNRSEIEGLIGFFVNTLVLRTDLSGDPTFAELLERTREVALGAYAHQDLPFEKLVEELGIDRDLAHSPAVQVMFVLQNTPPGHLTLPGVAPALLDAPTNEVSVDVTLDLTETPDGLVAKLVYNADLFDRRTMEALLRHYANLLAAAVEDAELPLSRLPLLDPAERRAIVEGFNPLPTPYPDAARVHELFERVARERPDAPAVVYGDDELTYRQLDVRANRIARYLLDRGVGRGDLVAISLERGTGLVAAMLGTLKAGAAYVPIDPEHPQRRTAFMLEDSEARALLTERELAAAGGCPGEPVEVPGDAGDVAYAIYTSGSTGTPKGICIPHRAIARLVLETDYVKLGPHSVIAQVANASFDAATFEIWGALLNGGVVAGIPKEVVLDARRFREALTRHSVDTMFLTTALFNQLVAEDASLFAGMDTVLVGGEAADAGSVRKCLEADPPRELINVYGPTESTTFATWYRVDRLPADATTIPIGRPIANTKVHVLDAAMNPVPVGVQGEIYVGGPGVGIGYLDRPELTKERFVPDPFAAEPGATLYRTGDLGRYLPTGDVEFLARIDSQVKIRGFRVELGEIESTLAEHHAVSDAVVALSPDKSVVAYVVLAEPVGRGELRRFVSERLPFYMVPTDFVPLEALPLNANGKIDRRALPAPDPSTRGPDDEHVPPRTPTEETLVTIWQELLGGAAVGVHDNFFELGGHSLLATQMVSRIRDAFSIELELREVFEKPTIARLAPVVDAAPRGASAIPELKALPRR